MRHPHGLKQPELFDLWGQRFYGKAQTISGDIWWYESNGKRFPLLPALVTADVSEKAIRKSDYDFSEPAAVSSPEGETK